MRGRIWVLAMFAAALALGCAHQPQTQDEGTRVTITVTEKGFEPAVVTVPAGQPVTLVVTRTTDMTCAKDFVMKSKGISKPLPLHKAVEIKLDPQQPGELGYACDMDMFKGTVKVQ